MGHCRTSAPCSMPCWRAADIAELVNGWDVPRGQRLVLTRSSSSSFSFSIRRISVSHRRDSSCGRRSGGAGWAGLAEQAQL